MDARVPALEEVFDPVIAQALQGKGGHDRKEWVSRLHARVAHLMESENGTREVAQYLACIRQHCFNQGKAEIVKSGLAAVGSVATGLDSRAGEFLKDARQIKSSEKSFKEHLKCI